MDSTEITQKQLLLDLVEYVKKPYELVRDRCIYASVELAWQWHFKKSIKSFYKDTDLYIFDLTAYQSKMVVITNEMLDAIAKLGINNFLDFGGGIGELTLRIMQKNIKSYFIDITGSKTLKYAKWRFNKYMLKPIYLKENSKWYENKWDLVSVMDVLEHLPDPDKIIKKLEHCAHYIYCNPEQIPYDDFFPQHISKFSIHNFKKIGTNLYENTKWI